MLQSQKFRRLCLQHDGKSEILCVWRLSPRRIHSHLVDIRLQLSSEVYIESYTYNWILVFERQLKRNDTATLLLYTAAVVIYTFSVGQLISTSTRL